MEQRKIMALGKASRGISLPKTWLKRNTLDRGNWVSLYIQSDGSLIVHPVLNVKEKVKEIHLHIDADETQDSIIRRMIGAYLDGYALIKLTSTRIFTVNQQKAIRQVVGRLYMMITESDASNMVIQTMIDESKASVSNTVVRMHIITYSMCRDTVNCLKNWDGDLARSVVSLEDDVDQLMYFLLRLIRGAAASPSLANQLGLDPVDCLDYQTLVYRIERVADHATTMAVCILALIEDRAGIPEGLLTTLVKAAEISFSSYDKAVQCFLSKDIGPTNEIIDRQREIEELYRDITPLPNLAEGQETSTLSHAVTIRERIMRISQIAADISELTIDRAYKSESIFS